LQDVLGDYFEITLMGGIFRLFPFFKLLFNREKEKGIRRDV